MAPSGIKVPTGVQRLFGGLLKESRGRNRNVYDQAPLLVSDAPEVLLAYCIGKAALDEDGSEPRETVQRSAASQPQEMRDTRCLGNLRRS